MKKQLISILCIIFLILSPQYAKAEEEVAYSLPYPGILPDSPVYPLKAIRDKVEGLFISDPLKKAEFNLNKADMRIAAAVSLIEKKKNIPLAESTISKAQNYFEEALIKTREVKKQGINTQDIVKKLKHANRKYQEILTKLEKKVEKKEQKKLDTVKKRLKEQRKTLTQIKD